MSSALKLPPQDWMRDPATRRVVDALGAEGAEVRFVGGCVRDALAGRPVKDVDLATHLKPEEVMRLLRSAGLKVVPTGIEHGTVTAVSDHRPFEITTLREDVETFGRHAKIAFTDDWTADAARRDFTFNALSAAPDGTVFDPFGGVADLRAGRVRFVGDARARIVEDYLRLLRFFRFQAHYGRQPPDAAVLAVTAELAPELSRLSGERIREELFKLLRADDPVPVVRLMVERGILNHILPTVGDVQVLQALRRVEPGDEPADAVARLAALLPADPGLAEQAAARLRLSRREREALIALADPAVAAPAPAHTKYRSVHKLGPALYKNALRLAWARQEAAAPQAASEQALEAALAEADALAAKRFPLQGRDVRALGIAEGPELGRLLAAVEAWWAEQGFRPSRADCLDHLRRLAGQA